MASEHPRTVILADDDDDFVCLATHTLLRAGYTVVSVTNGADLVTHTRAQLLSAQPGSVVVVADVDMPGLTGLEAAAHLGTAQAKLPLLLVTADYSPELLREAQQLGILGVLSKPVPPRVLTAAIESALSGLPIADVETLLIGRTSLAPPSDEDEGPVHETRRLRARVTGAEPQQSGATPTTTSEAAQRKRS